MIERQEMATEMEMGVNIDPVMGFEHSHLMAIQTGKIATTANLEAVETFTEPLAA
jgi:hypothetical protein